MGRRRRRFRATCIVCFRASTPGIAPRGFARPRKARRLARSETRSSRTIRTRGCITSRCAEDDDVCSISSTRPPNADGERKGRPDASTRVRVHRRGAPGPPEKDEDEDEDEDEDATLRRTRNRQRHRPRSHAHTRLETPHTPHDIWLTASRVHSSGARRVLPEGAYASADADVVMLAVRRKIADVARDESPRRSFVHVPIRIRATDSSPRGLTTRLGCARFVAGRHAVVGRRRSRHPRQHRVEERSTRDARGIVVDAHAAKTWDEGSRKTDANEANHRSLRAHPRGLRRATYPTVRAYANVYAEHNEEIRASRRAMTASGAERVFVADGEHREHHLREVEPGTAAAAVPFPPPRDSPESGFVVPVREERIGRGWLRAGGAENPRAFDEMLAEEPTDRRRRGGLTGPTRAERRANGVHALLRRVRPHRRDSLARGWQETGPIPVRAKPERELRDARSVGDGQAPEPPRSFSTFKTRPAHRYRSRYRCRCRCWSGEGEMHRVIG